MLNKAEEIAAYEEEIKVFQDRMKNALMPSRLKNEYEMMIDRLNALKKELTNEKDDTYIITSVTNDIPGVASKLLTDAEDLTTGDRNCIDRQDEATRNFG